MDNDLLRRACERAGLKVYTCDSDIPYVIVSERGHTLELDHPALPSYVADILTEMVRGRLADAYGAEGIEEEAPWWAYTPEQRITAAMEVLPDD